jgi:hypothetical protein
MRKFVMLFAAVAVVGFASPSVYANEEADALIKACEQQTQGASDPYAAVMKCLDEKLQYETE